MALAAPIACPIIDLIEETGGISAPNTLKKAADSAWSLASVPLPCTEMKDTSAARRSAAASADSIAWAMPFGSGRVMW